MTYFLLQTALISSIAVFSGVLMGWWLRSYLGKSQQQTSDNDLSLVKGYLAESIKENARLKIQLKHASEKLEVANKDEQATTIKGVDFEAYQAFEDTVKEANLRKYLN